MYKLAETVAGLIGAILGTVFSLAVGITILAIVSAIAYMVLTTVGVVPALLIVIILILIIR